MTLSDYLRAEEVAPSRFAASLGVPASTVLRLLKGERDPGLDLMRKIAVLTGGRVTPNDFAGIAEPASEDSAIHDADSTGERS